MPRHPNPNLKRIPKLLPHTTLLHLAPICLYYASKYIIFPKPILESEQVLVETKIVGQPLNEWYGGNGEVSPAHRCKSGKGSLCEMDWGF